MKWLFLVHQVQTPNSRERVKVWRLTRKVGSLLYRNSVYVLPYSKERAEDFHWLCQEIRDSKGEASVFVSEATNIQEDHILKQLFISARDKEYGEMSAQVDTFAERVKQMQSLSTFTEQSLKSIEKDLAQLEEAFHEIRRIDFFGRPGSGKIEKRLKEIRSSLTAARTQKGEPLRITPRSRQAFSGKTWATRAHIHIDRLCSAWLIKRFIDRKAKFVFAPESKLPSNAVLFDVFGAEFSHRGDRCTFETLLDSFSLDDVTLRSIAEIVHDIDLKDQKFNRAEASGLDLAVRSMSGTLRNDQRTLQLGSQLLDTIYQHLKNGAE